MVDWGVNQNFASKSLVSTSTLMRVCSHLVLSVPVKVDPLRPPVRSVRCTGQLAKKLDDRGEAHLIALACSPAPEGHAHWTLRLLAGKVVELGLASSMMRESSVSKKLSQAVAEEGVVHSQGERGICG